MQQPEAWNTWLEASIAVDNAKGLALIVKLDCIDSIGDERDRENASKALVSSIHAMLENAAELLETIEPCSESGAA